MSNSLWPHELEPVRLLCLWDFPSKNTGVGCHDLLKGIFPSQGSNLHLLWLLLCRKFFTIEPLRKSWYSKQQNRPKKKKKSLFFWGLLDIWRRQRIIQPLRKLCSILVYERGCVKKDKQGKGYFGEHNFK